MTLLEMTLVLTLLVLLAMLVIPSVRGPLASHALRKSGDVLQNALARGRIRAMETGQTHVFQYSLESGTFSLQPVQDDQIYSGTMSSVTPSNPAAASSSTATGRYSLANLSTQLPDGVKFVQGDSILDSRASRVVQMDTSGAASQMATPIFFYPDGTTSDAQLVVQNEYEACVVVYLRGLTGVTRVSRVMRRAEIGS